MLISRKLKFTGALTIPCSDDATCKQKFYQGTDTKCLDGRCMCSTNHVHYNTKFCERCLLKYGQTGNNKYKFKISLVDTL